MEPFILIAIGILLASAVILARQRFAAFQGQSPDDYYGIGPEFDLTRYLNGPIVCDGVIFGPTGRVTSRFTIDMMGTWSGNSGTLKETFRYDDGTRQDRDWHLVVDDRGRITARADDVIGTGMGQQCGPTVQLKYDIRLPETSGGHVLSVVDWMYLIEGGTMINRSQFRKYGIQVAELVAIMRAKETP